MAGPFDLSRFAPDPYFEFKLRNGQEYRCLADPDVDQVARMLKIELVLNGTEEGDLGQHLTEGKAILVSLIRQADPDANLDELRVGGQELVVIFSALLHGESVAEAVLETIAAASSREPSDDGSGSAGPLQQDVQQPEAAEEDEVSPLPSARPSPAASSALVEHDDFLRPTGTG